MLFKKRPLDKSETTRSYGKDSEGALNVKNVISALGDPIMVLNGRREVLFASEEAVALLGRNLEGRNIVQCLRQPQVIDAVDEVFNTGEVWEGEVSFPAPVQRYLSLRVAPIDEGAGVTIVIKDTTVIKRTEEMHSDFVANVSHELRSPLSALLGFIETLQGPASDDAEARERFLEIMIQEANRMARLIDDLLSLSRVEIQEHVRPSDPVDLCKILQNVTDILSLKAEKREMTFNLSMDAEEAIVLGDSDQLTQVFQNLIDNAIKYSRTGTSIDLTVRHLANMPDRAQPALAVDVRDYGNGIEVSHLPRLTERFYRVDKARSRAMGGTGLGLAIVKHIIARHLGRLQVESKPGEGSTFTVILPVR